MSLIDTALPAGPLRIKPFSRQLEDSGISPLTARGIEILQINVGRRCNLSCKHCHLQAGPLRRELMPRRILEQCLSIVQDSLIPVIDITGGAPEMNPDLAWFILKVAALGRRLLVRSNLVILLEPEYQSFIDIYHHNRVEIIGSLPNFHRDKTDRQRGPGTFDKAIAAIRILNERGYGVPESGLVLDLVHNPVGAFLPGSQQSLHQEYSRNLWNNQGVRFNRLFCITNNPSGRYLDYLIRSGNFEDYMELLAGAYNPVAACKVMCRTTLSIGWNGKLFDCDFNQALDVPVDHGVPNHIDKFDLKRLSSREIVVGDHCYACTAGCGSSCQGAVGS